MASFCIARARRLGAKLGGNKLDVLFRGLLLRNCCSGQDANQKQSGGMIVKVYGISMGIYLDLRSRESV
jgi:hypothetical protein